MNVYKLRVGWLDSSHLILLNAGRGKKRGETNTKKKKRKCIKTGADKYTCFWVLLYLDLLFYTLSCCLACSLTKCSKFTFHLSLSPRTRSTNDTQINDLSLMNDSARWPSRDHQCSSDCARKMKGEEKKTVQKVWILSVGDHINRWVIRKDSFIIL